MRPWALVTRLGGIGDCLIASSVLPVLARTHLVEVLTSDDSGVAVFTNNPYIAKLTVRKGDLAKDGMAWQEWFDDRHKDYDRAYNLSHSCEVSLALFKIQTAMRWPASWRRKYLDHSYLEFVHDICECEHSFAPQFYPTDEEDQLAADTKALIGPRYIGWVISGSRIDKHHPNSAAMIARLLKELNVPVVMFGGAGRDYELGKAILKEVARINGTHDGLHLAMSEITEEEAKALEDDWTLGPKMKRVPNWPIRRSLSQILTADLVISPDTGLAWAASMTDQPKIIMVSHASANNITKHWRKTVTLSADQTRVKCHPCHVLHDDYTYCTKNKDGTAAACISDIGVDAVVDAARLALRDPPRTLWADRIKSDGLEAVNPVPVNAWLHNARGMDE